MHLSIAFRLASIVGLVVAALGCGGKTMVRVSGTVSYQGKKVDNGAIVFRPVDSKVRAEGDNIKDGEYSVLLPLGKASVEITGEQLDYMKKLYDTPDSPLAPKMKQYIPARYNQKTELSRDIAADTTRLDFDLK